MKYTVELRKEALKFAKYYHDGQFDKGGEDYITHPLSVLAIVEDLYKEDFTEEDKILCDILSLLHDTMEDCDVTFEESEFQFGCEVAILVNILTHKESDSYMDYIKITCRNPFTRLVKLADLIHNSDLSRLNGNITLKDIERNEKYLKAIKYIVKNMEENKND